MRKGGGNVMAIYYGLAISKLAGWQRIGFMPPLCNDDGEPYVAIDLPCCNRPEWWDEDAPEGDKKTAAKMCRSCPALLACAIRRDELERNARGTATGVWAGVIMRATCRHEAGEACSCLSLS